MESVVTADSADPVCTVHIKLTETAHNGVVICSLDVFLVVSWCASVYGIIKNNNNNNRPTCAVCVCVRMCMFVCACVCVCICEVAVLVTGNGRVE